MRTGKAGFERQKRVSAILVKRFSGMGLREIGEAEGISPQAVHQLIQRALGQIPQQSVAEIRVLEAGRLDELQNAIWKNALAGDIAAIDRVLAIMKRRAALLGLDLQRGITFSHDGDEIDPRTVRVEIIGDPEPARVKWLEERVRELESGEAPASETPQVVN
jgi:hypothetical protein